jgi:predicted O-methyltransferase YrrM
MNGRIVRSIGRCLPPLWRRRFKRELLLRFPSLYATEMIRYEQSLTCDEEVQTLLSKLDTTLDVPGDIIECGCFLCGTTVLMARHLRKRDCNKRIYACDTFQGFDPAEFAREQRQGSVSGDGDFTENDLRYVQRKITRLGVADQITLVKGLFQETLASFPGPFAFAFIDADLHDSIWPRLSVGGCCVFDDYTNDAFRGATKAIDTFIAEQKPTIRDHGPLLHKMYFASKERP